MKSLTEWKIILDEIIPVSVIITQKKNISVIVNKSCSQFPSRKMQDSDFNDNDEYNKKSIDEIVMDQQQ